MLPHKVYLFVCLIIYLFFAKSYFALLSTHAKLVSNITSIIA